MATSPSFLDEKDENGMVVVEQKAKVAVLSCRDLMIEIVKYLSANDVFYTHIFVCKGWKPIMSKYLRDVHFKVHEGRFGVLILSADLLRYYRVDEYTTVQLKMLNPLLGKKQGYFEKTEILSSCNGLVLIGYKEKEKYFVGNPTLGVFTEPMGTLHMNESSCLFHEKSNNYFHIITLEAAKGNNSMIQVYDSRTREWESVDCNQSFVPGVKGILYKGGVVWIQPGGLGVRFVVKTREWLNVPPVDASQQARVFADGSGLLCVDVVDRGKVQFHKLDFAEKAKWEGAGEATMIPKCGKIRVMGMDSKRNVFFMKDGSLVKLRIGEFVFEECFNLYQSLVYQGGAYFPYHSRGTNDLVPFLGSLELAGIVPEVTPAGGSLESPLENVVGAEHVVGKHLKRGK